MDDRIIDPTAGTDADLDATDDVPNRPAGPDYGAGDTIDSEFGVGLDREEMTGTGEDNTGTGLGYDFDRGEVSEVDEEDRPA